MQTNKRIVYKNLIGLYSYSKEDQAFIGRIENINSIVSFEGENLIELSNNFKEAVEDYLDFCKEKGIKPNKTNQ